MITISYSRNRTNKWKRVPDVHDEATLTCEVCGWSETTTTADNRNGGYDAWNHLVWEGRRHAMEHGWAEEPLVALNVPGDDDCKGEQEFLDDDLGAGEQYCRHCGGFPAWGCCPEAGP